MSVRLWWKLNGFVVIFFVALSLAVGVAGIAYAWNLQCDPGLTPRACSQFLITRPPSWILTGVLVAIPILMGVLLGASAVAGGMESGSSVFAWSIVPDRRRLLVNEILEASLAVGLVGLLCGAINAVIVAKLNPGHDLPVSFAGYGLWGPILALRGLSAYGATVVLGTLLRRLVASVALGLIVSIVFVFLAMTIGRSFEPAQVIPNGDPAIGDALGVTSVIFAPDGSHISGLECSMGQPAGLSPEQMLAWQTAHCSETEFFLRGSQMLSVELRESLVLVCVGVAGAGLAWLLLPSRRP